MRRNNKAIISSSGWHLYCPRFLFFFFYPPQCHVFCSFSLSSIFGFDLLDYLLSCLSSPSIPSDPFRCFPWSVSLSISFSYFIPPLWILFHPSFCLFAFLNLSFSLIWPDFSCVAWFSCFPTPFFLWPPSSSQSPSICLPPSSLSHFSSFYNKNLPPSSDTSKIYVDITYRVLPPFSFPFFLCLRCELTEVLTQWFNT